MRRDRRRPAEKRAKVRRSVVKQAQFNLDYATVKIAGQRNGEHGTWKLGQVVQPGVRR